MRAKTRKTRGKLADEVRWGQDELAGAHREHGTWFRLPSRSKTRAGDAIALVLSQDARARRSHYDGSTRPTDSRNVTLASRSHGETGFALTKRKEPPYHRAARRNILSTSLSFSAFIERDGSIGMLNLFPRRSPPSRPSAVRPSSLLRPGPTRPTQPAFTDDRPLDSAPNSALANDETRGA